MAALFRPLQSHEGESDDLTGNCTEGESCSFDVEDLSLQRSSRHLTAGPAILGGFGLLLLGTGCIFWQGTPATEATDVERLAPWQRTLARNANLLASLDPDRRLDAGTLERDPCYSVEELFEGVCYKKCSILDPTFPNRTGSNACCAESAPCANYKDVASSGLGPCQGYGVGGYGCAHPPYLYCESGEELYGGLCYMKCSIMTNGTQTKRTAPNTCAKVSQSQPGWPAMGTEWTVGIGCQGFGVASDLNCPHIPKA